MCSLIALLVMATEGFKISQTLKIEYAYIFGP